MNIGLYDTIILLESLGYDCIPLKGLKETFFKPEEPPRPQGGAPQAEKVKVYPTYKEAAAAAQKGETTLSDDALKGFINVAS